MFYIRLPPKQSIMQNIAPIFSAGPAGEVLVSLSLPSGYQIFNISNDFIPPGENSNTHYNYTIHIHTATHLVNPNQPHDTRYSEDSTGADLTVFIFDEPTGQNVRKKKVSMPVKHVGNEK